MAKKKSKKNQKYFVDAWLEGPLFDGWLCKDKECNTQPRCSVCHKMTELSSSGRPSIADHPIGRKHKEAVEKRKTFFKAAQAKQATGHNEKGLINDDRKSTITDIYSSSNSSVKPEIIWTLKFVMGGCSGLFNGDINETFLAMFPDLKSVLNHFSLVRTESSYVINHGLAPVFKNQLETALRQKYMFIVLMKVWIR